MLWPPGVYRDPGVYRGPPEVYRGPPEVYRGPCMKVTPWNCPIYPTDALMAADRGMVTNVVLLDLSAAFETVERTTLLHCSVLRTRFGITGAALDWHKTYLSERSYRVVTGGAESEVVDLDCGLPQGSSLGPLKFIVYTAEMREVVNRRGVSFCGFADS